MFRGAGLLGARGPLAPLRRPAAPHQTRADRIGWSEEEGVWGWIVVGLGLLFTVFSEAGA